MVGRVVVARLAAYFPHLIYALELIVRYRPICSNYDYSPSAPPHQQPSISASSMLQKDYSSATASASPIDSAYPSTHPFYYLRASVI
jgi:hypothetical protein